MRLPTYRRRQLRDLRDHGQDAHKSFGQLAALGGVDLSVTADTFTAW